MMDSSRRMDAGYFAEAYIRFNRLEDLGDSKCVLASIMSCDPKPDFHSSAKKTQMAQC